MSIILVNLSAVKKLFIGILCLFALSIGRAQTDDLMIVEYVDRIDGTGVGLKIYNPTSQTIDLSEYLIATFHNGNTTSASSGQLDGMLAPKQFIIYGNGSFCDSCFIGCNTLTINGVNGNDAIALLKGITFIDMVGPLGVDTDINVGGIDNGLDEKRIIRNNDNCIRYTEIAGSGLNAWPDNATTFMPGWEVIPYSCLSTSAVNLRAISFEIHNDTTLCKDEELTLNYDSLNFNSYEWIGENNNTSEITITDSGNYILEITNQQFCSARDSILVEFDFCLDPPPPPPLPTDTFVVKFFIPNIITPNDDDKNETFIIRGITDRYELFIYNRWGKQVYESLDYQNDWKGEGLADGTYYYIVKQGYQEYKGWVELKR